MECVTRLGHAMNPALRDKIVRYLAERNGESLVFIAGQLGISRKTLRDYMTEEVLADAAALRDGIMNPSLEQVDRAMLAQACKGNVAAARLVYMRMAQKGHAGTVPTLSELEAELIRLKERETNRDKGLHDGETAGDAAAVGADAFG